MEYWQNTMHKTSWVLHQNVENGYKHFMQTKTDKPTTTYNIANSFAKRCL